MAGSSRGPGNARLEIVGDEEATPLRMPLAPCVTADCLLSCFDLISLARTFGPRSQARRAVAGRVKRATRRDAQNCRPGEVRARRCARVAAWRPEYASVPATSPRLSFAVRPMSATEPGPRDHLVTRRLSRGLEGLAPEVIEEVPLDAAEAPERLARHAMDELRRELAGSEESADEQAARVNAVLGNATTDNTDAEVLLPARLLRGVKRRSPLGDVAAASAAAGDAVQPERSARQRRGPAEHRLRAARRARDARIRSI